MIPLLVLLLLAFFTAAALISLYVYLVLKAGPKPAGGESRDQLITLAARAASDDSGRSLLALLQALEAAPPGAPVTVNWLQRLTARYDGKGFLVKINWDGNEWRQAISPVTLRTRLEAALAVEPGLASAESARLLIELAQAEAA